uniref:LysM domain-containing protein n=1 Tax=Elaeophora elaphi TaxID=1147741 RepID=A0A0R3RXH5_9BILA
MDGQDERTFLCGYQRTRGYGSLSNLHVSMKTYRAIIQHQIRPNDTLQGLVLKYNTSMSEIKRLNRLWSNESLYLKEYVKIPIYDEILEKGHSSDGSTNVKNDRCCKESKKFQDIDGESVQDIFKRIDMNIRKTTCSVHKLTENSTADLLAEGFEMEFRRSKPECRKKNRRSLNCHSSGFQNETYQN